MGSQLRRRRSAFSWSLCTGPGCWRLTSRSRSVLTTSWRLLMSSGGWNRSIWWTGLSSWTASEWGGNSRRWVLHHDPGEARLCHRWVVDSRSCCGTPGSHRALGIEFARAGADITQTFTFWAHDDALPKGCKFTCAEINQAACNTAKKVAREWGTIVAGGITQTGTFNLGSSVKSKVQNELR